MTPTPAHPGPLNGPNSGHSSKLPIGEVLRTRRVETLGKGLREMAKLLDIAPAHLTDIEKGRRTASEELLLRIAKSYWIAEATLRAGWGRAETDVGTIASSNPINAAKVPELLREAKDLDASQWDELIAQARKMAKTVKDRPSRKSE